MQSIENQLAAAKAEIEQLKAGTTDRALRAEVDLSKTLSAQLSALRAETDDLKRQHAAATAEASRLSAALAVETEARKQAEANVAKLTDDIGGKLAAFMKTQESAEKKAARIIAATGIDPLNVTPDTTPQGDAADLSAQIASYHAEKDPTKRAQLWAAIDASLPNN